MSKFVVDANVAIKWVLSEVHSEIAQCLLDDAHELLVPDFFFSEIGNILWKRVRRGETTLELAQNDLTVLMAGDLQIYPSQSLMPMALEIAVRVDQAVYDCVYLSLAVINQCQMVTADERFYNAISRDVLCSHLCWIENFL
ncbi:type II toxin-antitoxin system VapC family toxin [Planktothrix sp. FACHB-1365]|uniref:type II toxin-antitoxin system VapC family toxin n=1 Tax=Planktothrix sp. FACHB-1365 TaxID=2692855 RepID=UPI00168685C4|nr:type II toxin-antitoxin system VapC family toxin [Planktothrix sp. FACHB-1365]MBD2481325.1 type II toxin-antitoxin system VapC family toxin [Planktothrix sp. FACHB-1365]